MIPRAGTGAPLHRKFSMTESLTQIRNRYRTFNKLLGRQVQELQRNTTFLTQARQFYADGYKDWHILSAVFNLRLNWEMRRLNVDIESGMQNKEIINVVKGIVGLSVEPAERIVEAQTELLRMFDIGDVTCLKTYGFEPRRPDLRPEALKRFLQERMRHYELDIEHSNLFGDPVGDWPTIEPE